MAFPVLAAFLFAGVLPPQESVLPPAPLVPLPRSVANAPMARVNESLDGRRFLMSRPAGGVVSRPNELVLAQNAFEDLKAKVKATR